MTDESELATLSRRVTLLEQDAEGEKTISRHILRKVGDVENAILDLTKAVADLTKVIGETQRGQSRLEDFVMTSQAAQSRQFAEIAAVTMREELAKQRK